MTDNTEPTAFEIHLHCIRPLLNKTFEHEKRVSFELFKEMANQHFENIYGNENDNFLKELFDWFVEKEIFETVGNKYGGRIYTYNKSQESKMGFVGVFHSQFQTILRAMDREEAMAWRFEALRNSLADVEYDELEVGDTVTEEDRPEIPSLKPASVVPIWSDGVLINDDRNLSVELREELATAAFSSMRDEMLSLASDIESEGNIDTRPAKYLKHTAEMLTEAVPNTKELFALIRREATLIDYFDVVKEQWPDFLVSRYGAMVQEFTLELDAFDERQEFQRQRNKNSLKSYDIIELKYDMTMVVASMKTELAATRIDGSIPEIIEGIDGNKPDELNESPNRDDVVNLDSIESLSNVLKQLAVRGGDDPVANEVKDMLNKNYVEGFSGSLAKAARKAGEEDGEKIGKTVPRVEVGMTASKDTRKWLSQKYPKLLGWLK